MVILQSKMYITIPEMHKLYFLDFENLLHTRKWPLIEIIQKCFWLKRWVTIFMLTQKI